MELIENRRCEECNYFAEKLVELGEEDCQNSRTAFICENCIYKAIKLISKKKYNEKFKHCKWDAISFDVNFMERSRKLVNGEFVSLTSDDFELMSIAPMLLTKYLKDEK